MEDKLKEAYEMSVKAYQFSVQRHREWMYLYAIITGALFVALYGINTDTNIFRPIISILGAFTTFCWILSFIGHYEWTKSFIKITKKNERLYFDGQRKTNLYVYDGVIPNKSDTKDENAKYLPGFYSTQKVTIFFLNILLIVWEVVFVYELFKALDKVSCCPKCIVLTAVIILLLIFEVCFIFTKNRPKGSVKNPFCSNVENGIRWSDK